MQLVEKHIGFHIRSNEKARGNAEKDVGVL